VALGTSLPLTAAPLVAALVVAPLVAALAAPVAPMEPVAAPLVPLVALAALPDDITAPGLVEQPATNPARTRVEEKRLYGQSGIGMREV
jgi:hypothetical protein